MDVGAWQEWLIRRLAGLLDTFTATSATWTPGWSRTFRRLDESIQ